MDMTRITLKGRMYALVAVFALLVGGVTAYALSRSSDEEGRRDWCWGTLSAEDFKALLPPGRYSEAEPRDAPLPYPAVSGATCRVTDRSEAIGNDWIEYLLTSDYFSQKVSVAGLYSGVQSAYPLGPGLNGFVSDFGGVVEVPPCRAADPPYYFQLTVRNPKAAPVGTLDPGRTPIRAGHHVLIGEVLVRVANAIRVKAGCTGDVLPAAAPPAEAPVTPYDPQELCGRRLTGVELPTRPAWTQRWSGNDGTFEDCKLWDPAAADPSIPAIGLTVFRGRLAVIEPFEKPGASIHPTSVPGATYRADCPGGPVFYRLDGQHAAPFVDAVALLRAIVQADAARDGCVVQ